MLFHRRGLTFGYAVLLLSYLVTRFLPSFVDKIILNPLMIIGNYLPNISTTKINIQSFEMVLHDKQTLFRLLLIWLTVFTVFWTIIDIFSGQLYRDYRSAQLSRYLRRSNVDISREERRANRWISRSRFIRWNGQTMLIIPCVGNSAVERIIQKRCDSTLMQWLSDNFKKYSWQPMIVKHSGFITFLVIKTKK